VSWHARLSRRVNGWLGHNPGEMVCARLWRTHHPSIPLIDAAFLVLRGERDHCQRQWAYESECRSPVERARRAGL
jgi:hypothetical protein